MPNPIWVIDPNLAQARINNYLPKKHAIETNFGITNEVASFEFTAKEFIKGFQSLIIDNRTGGLRFYIANLMRPRVGRGDADENDNNTNNKLALIISPTTVKRGVVPNESAPDLGNLYYFIYRNRKNQTVMRKVRSQNNDTTRRIRWQASYLSAAAKHEYLVRTFDVYETRSIWYNLSIITGSYGSPGMIDFVNSNKIEKVVIHLATRNGDEQYANHLDIVFELSDNENKFYTSLNIDDIKKNLTPFTDVERVKLLEIYGDTGLPCPPRVCN